MPSWRGLRARLLVAHLLVIVIGTAALSVTAWVAAPRILDFRVAMMAEHRVPMPMSALPGSTFDAALVDVFRQSLNQALLIGALAALAAALVATVVVTRQVAGPVQRLAVAARRLATGRYADRVPTSGTTELDDLTSSFNYMAAALESSEARRLQLIGDVAHELRTPISTLEAYLDGLADGIVQPSGDVWALLRAEGDRVRKLVEDLHELWQAEGKQLPLEIGAIPPVSLVEPTAARFGPDLAAKGLTLAVSAPENLPPVRADRDRALQVLANLLGNALATRPPPVRSRSASYLKVPRCASASATPGLASRRSTCLICSSASTGWKSPAAGRWAGPAWAWPSRKHS
ncbi:MAG: HAMP domain-containing protein [Chloroflexi bacterium]|nr:HAMP domain-containing protein [Chloroflexota bacterium]